MNKQIIKNINKHKKVNIIDLHSNNNMTLYDKITKYIKNKINLSAMNKYKHLTNNIIKETDDFKEYFILNKQKYKFGFNYPKYPNNNKGFRILFDI